MPGLGSDPLDIVVRTTVIYLFVVVGLRFGGKRQVGQLSIVDLVVLLLLSNAVQNAMVGENSSIVGGVVAGASILILGRGLSFLIDRFQPIRRLVVGEPRILIRDGDVRLRAMRQEEVSVDELMAALREHGLEETKDVKLAILEVDGSISVVPLASGKASATRKTSKTAKAAATAPVEARATGEVTSAGQPDSPEKPGKSS